jgi:hypothetical protein
MNATERTLHLTRRISRHEIVLEVLVVHFFQPNAGQGYSKKRHKACTGWNRSKQDQRRAWVQGGLVPNKISGVGTNYGLLVHVLPGPNKQRAWKPRMILS